jgi:mono/diheme cytochrome c family protein
MMIWNKRSPHGGAVCREKRGGFAQNAAIQCRLMTVSARNAGQIYLESILPLRTNMHKLHRFVILLGLAVLLTACSLASDITPPPGSELPAPQATRPISVSPVFPIVPPDLTNGAKIYNDECAQCHGVKGMGDGPQALQLSVPVAALGLSDFSRQFTPAEWYTIVKQGNLERFMPAFANLSDRQLWDVVAYAMSLSAPQELVTQGKTLYQENCAACHGLSGKGDGIEATKLTNQPADFSDQSFMAKTSAASLFGTITNGRTPDMPAFSGTLDENERWALVAYLRSLTYITSQSSSSAYPAPGTESTSQNAYPAPTEDPAPVETLPPILSITQEISTTATFTGSVSITLINGSGADAPNDATVNLYGFDSMQNTYSETLTTGVDGIYKFNDVLMPAERVFLAGVEYASGTYGSDIITVDPTTPDLNLQVTVYDSTTDTSSLTTDRAHIFFDFTDPNNPQVIEVFIVSNPTKLAVVSATEGGPVVTYPLPEGYTNLQFQNGELGDRFIEVPQGFADTLTVNPGVGDYQVIFAFQLPYNRKLEFTQTMFLPTSAVVVMVPDNGTKVVSDQLVDGGVRDFNGSTYQMYNASSLLAGSALEFTLSGSPEKSATSFLSTGTMTNLAIGLAVFGIALVVSGLWVYRRNQKKAAQLGSFESSDVSDPGLDTDTIPDDEETLMDAIIVLDDQYKAGNLPEEPYLERRAALKDKLRKISPES